MRWKLYRRRPVKSAKSVAFPLGLNPLKSDTECKCSASPHETADRRRHEGTCIYARQLQNIYALIRGKTNQRHSNHPRKAHSPAAEDTLLGVCCQNLVGNSELVLLVWENVGVL